MQVEYLANVLSTNKAAKLPVTIFFPCNLTLCLNYFLFIAIKINKSVDQHISVYRHILLSQDKILNNLLNKIFG